MTIFQKMLFVPIVSILLFTSFLFYSYFEHQKYSHELATFNTNYIPQLDISNKNNLLFKQLSEVYKDAVLANEVDWLNNTGNIQTIIEDNFDTLQSLTLPNEQDKITEMREHFALYVKHAELLARKVIKNESILISDNKLMADVNHSHNQCQQSFLAFSQRIQRQFQTTLDTTNKSFNQILLIGGLISIAAITLSLTITVLISFSTKKSVNQITQRMKSLALGDADFSHRLVYSQRDELGYLIHWFNKLSDKLEENHQELERVSITDKLTQLNNRNRADVYFPLVINQAKESNSAIAVVILDIDKFKLINDTYGHMIGDEVLKAVADILKNKIDKDAFLCRWGGEEFVIILPFSSSESVFQKIDTLRENIATTTFEEVGTVTASFGVAISKPTDDEHSLMERADKYLYQAKEQGRNRVMMELNTDYALLD